MRGSGGLLVAIAIVLAIGLATLAVVQWRWIGELSAAEEEHERGVLQFAARQFADETEREVGRIVGSFQNADERELARRLLDWRNGARDRRLIESIWVVHGESIAALHDDGSLTPAEWPADLDAVRQRIGAGPALRYGPLVAEVPAIVIPLRPRPPIPPGPLAGPRPPFASGSRATRNTLRRPFDAPPRADDGEGRLLAPPPGERPPIRAAFDDGRGDDRFAADAAGSQDQLSAGVANAPRNGVPGDAPRSLLVIRLSRAYLTGSLFPDLAKRLGPAYDLAVVDGRSVVYRSTSVWPANASEHAEAEAELLHAGGPLGAPPTGWRILVRAHAGAVASLVAAARRRNLAISFAVVSILALSFILLAAIARRAERLRMQQLEFVAGITHELNTPLAAIRSAGQNLADGVVADPPQIARYGSMIARESTRLADLVAQVLDFAGLQSRSVTPHAPFDVAAVIREAVEQSKWLADEKHITVEVSVASDLPPVEGDAPAVVRAVQNLITNAIRHGGEGAWAGVSAARERGGIAISVADRGRGIATGDLSRIFEPFYRGRGASRVRGSGLGLAIVRQVAKQHGGSVTVDRHVPRGAAFTIHLPAREPAAARAAMTRHA